MVATNGSPRFALSQQEAGADMLREESLLLGLLVVGVIALAALVVYVVIGGMP